jgi:hypothetical protein
MLRMALIASLVLFNLSVWVGPAEVLAARGKAMLKSSPRHEVAERFVMEGAIESAAMEYQVLLQAEPENATYHAEYGMLCFNNGEALQKSFGWPREQLLTTVVEHFKTARDLSPGDISMATQYAMALMDVEFFGTDLPVDITVEAWSDLLTIVAEKRAESPDWAHYRQATAHTYLQLARTEFRYGRKAEMEKYVAQALAESPKLRIPKELREM